MVQSASHTRHKLPAAYCRMGVVLVIPLQDAVLRRTCLLIFSSYRPRPRQISVMIHTTPRCSAVLLPYIYVVNYWKVPVCLSSVCMTGGLIELQGGTTQGFGASGGGTHNDSSQRVTFARIRGVSADGALSIVSSLLILWVSNTVLLLSKDGVLTFR